MENLETQLNEEDYICELTRRDLWALAWEITSGNNLSEDQKIQPWIYFWDSRSSNASETPPTVTDYARHNPGETPEQGWNKPNSWRWEAYKFFGNELKNNPELEEQLTIILDQCESEEHKVKLIKEFRNDIVKGGTTLTGFVNNFDVSSDIAHYINRLDSESNSESNSENNPKNDPEKKSERIKQSNSQKIANFYRYCLKISEVEISENEAQELINNGERLTTKCENIINKYIAWDNEDGEEISESLNLNGSEITDYLSIKNYFENINNNGYNSINLGKNISKTVLANVRLKHLDDILDIIWEWDNLNLSEIGIKQAYEKLKEQINSDEKLKSILKSYSRNFENGKDIVKILGTFLYNLWHKVPKQLRDSSIIKNIQQDSSILNRQAKFFNDLKKRNLARNQKISEKNTVEDNFEEVNVGKIDLQTASWTDIARNAWLWDDLKDYSMDDKFELSNDELKKLRNNAFSDAWWKFIQDNEDVWWYITDLHMIWNPDKKWIYDFENNSIDETAWKDLKQKLLDDFKDEIDVNELNKIHDRLLGFANYMDDEVDALTENYILEKWMLRDNSKIDAIGGVIDSIKAIFDKLWEDFKLWQLYEWFLYDEKEPVKITKIDWKDMLVIKGSINWTKTKVCYDLREGDLYMNSFIKESTNLATITIWDRWDAWDNYPQADKKIWSIDSFEEILSDIDISTEFENIDNDHNHHVGGSENQAKEDLNFNNPVNKPTEIDNNGRKPRWWGFWMKVMRRRWSKWWETWQRMDPRYSRPQQPLQQRPWPQLPDNLWETYQNNIETSKLIFQNKINTTLDLIWDQVKKYSEIQAQKNDIVTNFLKTFNIMQEDGTQKDGSLKSMEFHQDSDIYKVLHIINNYKEDELSQLSEFSKFMWEICTYGGLTWGKNNVMDQQPNKMYKEVSEADENNENSARWCLKQSLSNLRNESLALSQSNNQSFRSDRPLWIAALIVKNVLNTDPNNIANAKFDKTKMDNFLNSLTSGKEVSKDIEDNPDKILDQLDNI